jgi:2-keto-4-pentenoate hydratase/2-oxohepta-3-ene-1,7-dioic acid hydratase in catechol pathway
MPIMTFICSIDLSRNASRRTIFPEVCAGQISDLPYGNSAYKPAFFYQINEIQDRMKITSYSNGSTESYGIVEGETIVDLGACQNPPQPSLRVAIAAGLSADSLGARGQTFALKDVILRPPIPDPHKIICVGLNYRAHALEGGFELPAFPSVFMRASDTLVAHHEPLQKPLISDDFDYEGELAIVIGKAGRHITEENALEHVFGYTCFNDGSIRDVQLKQSLIAGKNFPKTGALGPWIVTANEIPDPSRLILATRINGRKVQHKGVDDMIFNVAQIISYISGWTRLEPGDVIATGTPEGVGFVRKPPLWLKVGDTVEVEISSIGTLVNPVASER